MPNLVFITRPSLQILGNSDGGIPYFRISGQSLLKENCHNSRTSDDIDIKLGAITKLDLRNKITSKYLYVDVMSKKYDGIVIFLDF